MKKIGLLIPSTNLTVENEIQLLFEKAALKTEDICFYTSKLEYKTRYQENQDKFLNELSDNSLVKIKELEHLEIDCFAFFCTTSALSNAKKEILNNPITALTEAIDNCNIKKCLLITPYNNKLGNQVKDYLEKEGIEVAETINLDLSGTNNYFNYGKEELEDLIIKLYNPIFENIIISCTNLPTLHFIDRLEKQLNTKIISSNSSLIWKILRDNKIKNNSSILGCLGGTNSG